MHFLRERMKSSTICKGVIVGAAPPPNQLRQFGRLTPGFLLIEVRMDGWICSSGSV